MQKEPFHLTWTQLDSWALNYKQQHKDLAYQRVRLASEHQMQSTEFHRLHQSLHNRVSRIFHVSRPFWINQPLNQSTQNLKEFLQGEVSFSFTTCPISLAISSIFYVASCCLLIGLDTVIDGEKDADHLQLS